MTIGLTRRSVMTLSIMTMIVTIFRIIARTWHDGTHKNDTQRNDIQHRDSQSYDTQHNSAQHNDTQHSDIQLNDTKNNDTMHIWVNLAFSLFIYVILTALFVS
jgi:hypothetical protein